MALTNGDDDEGILRETRDALPSHYLLKVESFSLFSKNGVEKYESKEFEAGGYKWKIIFFPNGNKSANVQDHISIYLAMASNLSASSEVNAVYRFFLFDQIRGKYLAAQGSARRFDRVKSEWGFSKFIPLKKFTEPSNGYLVSDACFFGVEVFVIKSSGSGESISLSALTNISYKHEWKISQFSKLEESCYSDAFVVGGYKWKLSFHPKGDNRSRDCNLSLYIVFADSKSFTLAHKVKAEFTITLKDQTTNQKHVQNKASSWFGASIPTWGWRAFIPLKDFNDYNKGFLVNDCCVVEAEVKVLAEMIQDTL